MCLCSLKGLQVVSLCERNLMGRGLFPPRCYKPDVRCDKCYKCSSLSFCFVSSVLMVCAEGINIAKIEWLMLIHHNNVFFFFLLPFLTI